MPPKLSEELRLRQVRDRFLALLAQHRNHGSLPEQQSLLHTYAHFLARGTWKFHQRIDQPWEFLPAHEMSPEMVMRALVAWEKRQGDTRENTAIELAVDTHCRGLAALIPDTAIPKAFAAVLPKAKAKARDARIVHPFPPGYERPARAA